MKRFDTKITKRTIISTIINIIAIINAIMTMAGKPILNISDSDIDVVITVILTVGTWVYGFWKNNSFTTPAILADDYLAQIRKDQQDEGN